MSPSDNKSSISGAQGHKSPKETRNEGLEREIEDIWKEVYKDVQWLSQPPPDEKTKKKWHFTRIFHGEDAGKEKKDPTSPQKGDSDESLNGAKDPTKTVLKLVQDIKSEKATDKNKNSESVNTDKLEKTLTNTLKCISTLGSRLAGAVSPAFAPAPSCFEAINFFLQFWLNYVEMLNYLDTLLSTCNDFIGRLHIYKIHGSKEKDIDLQHIYAKILRCLVKIFRFSISMQSKRKISKELSKQAFLGESGIDALVEEMKFLVESENVLLTALSYRNIRQILAQQQTTADAKKWRIAIANALGFDDEPRHVWDRRFKEISNTLIPNTGTWVTGVKEFEKWVAWDGDTVSKDETRPILVIKGAENTGKTYLMANIARYLRRIRPGHSIAYYFHEAGADRQMDRNHILSLVSRCLLWQCATSSELLIKSMAEKCQKMGYNPNVYDIWRQLFLENTEIKNVKNDKQPFYILIDGLESVVLKDSIALLQQLSDCKEQRFRIVLSTRSSKVLEWVKSESAAHIPLLKDKLHNNRADIEMYIQHKLANIAAFDGTKHPKAAYYKKKIVNTLSDETKGDFQWMTVVLEKLRLKHYLTDIDEVLENVKKPKEGQIKTEIDRLNQELESEDIEELNKVILWVLTAQVTPSLDDMTAVLSLGPHTDSLMALDRRLNPLLHANESGRIQFRFRETKNLIPKEKTSPGKPDQSDIDSSSQLLKAEVDTVHRFLQHVAPQTDKYDTKKLERLLWGDPMKITLCYDEHNAQIQMALTCLKVLTSENKDTEILRPYGGNFLLYHLKETKLQKADEDLKKQVGPLLVKLLTEGHCIDALFWTRAEHMSQSAWEKSEGVWLKENRERWLYTSNGVTQMLKWFSDPSAVEDVDDLGNHLIKEFVEEENAGRRHEILLRVAAERLATHLFLGNVYTVREQRTAVYFLHGYVRRGDITPCVKDCNKMQGKDFHRIRDWAAKSDGVGSKDEKNSWLWKIQLARTIFTVCKYDHKAIKKAKALLNEVHKLDKRPWECNNLACWAISEYLRMKGQSDKAQKVLEKATARISRAGGEGLTSQDSLLIAMTFLDLAILYSKKDDDRAVDMVHKSLSYDTTRYALYLKILQYRKIKDRILDLLVELTEKRQFDKLYLNRLVYDFIASDLFQEYLLQATTSKNWKIVVDQTFTKAIEVAYGCHAELFHIRKAHGNILRKSVDDASRDNEVIDTWEKALEHGKLLTAAGNDTWWPELFTVIDPLANIYLNRAQKALDRAAHKRDNRSVASVQEDFDTANHNLYRITMLEQKTDLWMNANVSCCLARYHIISNDYEKARKAVVRIIASSIDLLSDNDKSNDWFAYLQLAKTLSVLHDKENSEKAWKRLDKLGKTYADLLPQFPCSGCDEQITLAKGLHICTKCFGPRYLDDQCYANRDKKLKECSSHTYTKIFPEAEGDVRLTDLDHWKNELRGKHLIGDDVGDITPTIFSIHTAQELDAEEMSRVATPTIEAEPPPSEDEDEEYRDKLSIEVGS